MGKIRNKTARKTTQRRHASPDHSPADSGIILLVPSLLPGQALLSEVVSRKKPNNTLTFFIPFFPAGGAGGAMPLGVFFAPVGRALLSGVGVRRKPDNALHRHLPVGVVWRQDCLGCGVPGSIGPSGLLCAQAACGKLVRS